MHSEAGAGTDWRQLWLQVFHQQAASSSLLQVAFESGRVVNEPEQVFWLGYQCAVMALLKDSHFAGLKSQAVAFTEKPDLPPATLRMNQGRWVLEGHKSFVTNPGFLDNCVITAKAEDGVKAVCLSREALEKAQAGSEAVPGFGELEAGGLRFRSLPVDEEALLPGDGQRAYNARFRWLEDHCVSLAFCGWLWQGLQQQMKSPAFPEPLAEELLSLAAALQQAPLDQSPDAMQKLASAGSLTRLAHCSEALRPLLQPQTGAARWAVMTRILGLAAAAREKRRGRAWLTLSDDAQKAEN